MDTRLTDLYRQSSTNNLNLLHSSTSASLGPPLQHLLSQHMFSGDENRTTERTLRDLHLPQDLLLQHLSSTDNHITGSELRDRRVLSLQDMLSQHLSSDKEKAGVLLD